MSIKQSVEQILIYICYIINIFVPKNKKQVFFYSMPDYSDNARAIYEELVRQKLNKKHIHMSVLAYMYNSKTNVILARGK